MLRRSSAPARLALTAGVLAGCTVLASGCGRASSAASTSPDGDGLHGTDISDVVQRPDMRLQDTSGKTWSLRDRPPGELTVLYFGYTRCPDLCPTTMADLAAARRQLPAADRKHLEVVFVTEDPATDSAPVLRRYLDGFDASFIGLTGGDPEAERTLDALKAPRTVVLPSAGAGTAAPKGGGTVVQHTNSVYVFSGARTVVYTDTQAPSDYAADFSALLKS